MATNVTEAIEEVNLIKKVIDRTQNDFSRIANFFIFIGLINMVTYLVYAVLFQIISGMEQVGYPFWMFFRGFKSVIVIGYIFLFFCYRRQLKKQKNDLSLSLINIWGTLLIGGEVFRMLFAILNDQEQSVYFYQKTLAFLFPVIGCLVLGFIIQKKLIQSVSFVVIFLYMLLAGLGVNVRVAVFHGTDVNIGLDMIFTAVVMSVGMILLGIYLKGKGER